MSQPEHRFKKTYTIEISGVSRGEDREHTFAQELFDGMMTSLIRAWSDRFKNTVLVIKGLEPSNKDTK